MVIIEFLKNNYQWIFEGLGVVIITGLATFLTRMWRVKNSGQQQTDKNYRNLEVGKMEEELTTGDIVEYYTALNDDFARYTINTRFKAVYKDNNLANSGPEGVVNITSDDFIKITPKEVVKNDENYSGLVQSFLDDIKKYIGMEVNKFYNTAPFLLVEYYFYYKILLGLDSKLDPFRNAKLESLKANQNDVARIVSEYEYLEVDDKKIVNKGEILRRFINSALFGNTTDLSQDGYRKQLIQPIILKDQFESFLDYASNRKIRKIDILADNTGVELLTDLILAMVLIELGYTKTITFHVKVLPIFVSDTIKSDYGDDFKLLLDHLDELSSVTPGNISAKFAKYLANGQIQLKPDFFWNMPNDFKNSIHIFMKIIGRSDLVIIKGDLNFRRLVEDKTWRYDWKLSSILSYLKVPCLILRTIKSSTIVDLDSDMIKQITQNDIVNKTNGKYGTILFNRGRS